MENCQVRWIQGHNPDLVVLENGSEKARTGHTTQCMQCTFVLIRLISSQVCGCYVMRHFDTF